MKKVYSLFLFFFFIVSCKGQDTTKTVGISITSDPASDIVSDALKDKNGNIWFGSDFTGVGIFFYNGKSFTNVSAKEILTDKEGWLYSVMTIAQDNDGHLWFGSRGGYIFRYNGKSFTDFSGKVFKQQ